MPLKAKIEGKAVISIGLSDDEWDNLKKVARFSKSSIKLLCCDSSPYLRISKLGTKHFVHKTKNNCNWKPESIDHLRLKEIIFNVCKENGWNVETEYSFNNWIADIFATKGTTKLAFEIQLSRQTDEETKRRQEKYRKDGINGIWFFRYIPQSLKVDNENPAFKLIKKDGNYFLSIGLNEIEIGTAIKNFLDGDIEYRKKLTYKKNQIAQIFKFEMKCWRCGKIIPVISVYSYYISHCGHELCNTSISDEDLGMEIASLQKKGLKELNDLAPIEKRYSKTMGNSYYSNGCKFCGAIVGEWFLQDELLDFLYTNPQPILKVPFVSNKQEPEDYEHWCVKGNEGFCEV